jgi:diguanylate cyclase (GGDEF)-like protein
MDGEVTPTSHDDATDQRLKLLVGLVVVSGGIAFSLMASQLALTRQLAGLGTAFAALVSVAFVLGARIRVGATRICFAPTSAAILVGTVFLPAGLVVSATALGVLASTLILSQRPIKLAYNVGRETLAAAAATGAAACAEASALPLPEQPTALQIFVLAIAAAAYTLVDEACSIPLFALVTRTSLRQRALAHLDVRLTGQVIAFLIACLTIWAYDLQPWLVFVLPLLLFGLHLTSANQVRARTEREAWQRLAQATDELNTVDLEKVVATAVVRAAELFSADEIDLEIRSDTGSRVIRGTRERVLFDGPRTNAPVVTGHAIPIGLDGYGGETELGVLILRFREHVELSERERYTLRTYAAALFTAIRNATTFAETQRLASDHAKAAAQDPLTGLANRRRLHEYGEEVLARQTVDDVTALLLIDLNHFKEVNETLGHGAGDRLLVEVSKRLAAAVQPEDLVARLGGDEFAVLFVGLAAPALALSKAHAVLTALSTPMDLDGMRLGIEASGGVATAPPGQETAGSGTSGIVELLRRADIAMYHAKREGRRIATYARSHDTASVGSLTLGGDLARAIAERQFTVDFQPIVDLGSGQTIAAEALARWNHPERGFLGPAAFLDAVERSGQLPGFADLVLDLALAAMGEWTAAGFPLTVAVNCSPRSLLDPSFPDSVASGLALHGVPPETLMIELTESTTLSQLRVVDEVLSALRALGVRLALDDFGTGYSSLSTIARVPVHELKIDRSFVSAMDTPASGAVVRSTIELGRSLDLLVVAEGVETELQRQRLWELGCPAGQGHLFARPMASQRLLGLLRRGADGRRGTMAPPIHQAGSVIRMPPIRRGRNGGGQQRFDQRG